MADALSDKVLFMAAFLEHPAVTRYRDDSGPLRLPYRGGVYGGTPLPESGYVGQVSAVRRAAGVSGGYVIRNTVTGNANWLFPFREDGLRVSDLALASGDWCVDFHAWFDNTAGSPTDCLLFGAWLPEVNGCSWGVFASYNATGVSEIYYATSSDGTTAGGTKRQIPLPAGGLPFGSVAHIAVSRSGDTHRGFIAGVKKAEWSDASRPFVPQAATAAASYRINSGNYTNANTFMLYAVHMVRVTHGAARWTADFAAPGVLSDYTLTMQADGTSAPRRVGRTRALQNYTTPSSVVHSPRQRARRFTPAGATPRNLRTRPIVPGIARDTGGAYARIAGTVKVKGTPDQPRGWTVLLYEHTTKMLVDTAQATSDGNYVFRSLDPARRYFAVAFDPTGGFRGTIADNLTPTVE